MTTPEPPAFRCEEHGISFLDRRGFQSHLHSKAHGHIDGRSSWRALRRSASSAAPAPLAMNITPEEWVRFLAELLAQRQELRGMVEKLSRELEAKLAELQTLRQQLETADATVLYLRAQVDRTVSAVLSNEQAEVYQEYARRLS